MFCRHSLFHRFGGTLFSRDIFHHLICQPLVRIGHIEGVALLSQLDLDEPVPEGVEGFVFTAVGHQGITFRQGEVGDDDGGNDAGLPHVRTSRHPHEHVLRAQELVHPDDRLLAFEVIHDAQVVVIPPRRVLDLVLGDHVAVELLLEGVDETCGLSEPSVSMHKEVSRSSDVVGGLSDHEIQPADDLEPTHPPFFGLLQRGPLGALLLFRLPGFMYVLHEILHLLAPFHEVTGLLFRDVVGFAVVFLDDLARDVVPLGLLPATIRRFSSSVLRHPCPGVPVDRPIEELATLGHIAQHIELMLLHVALLHHREVSVLLGEDLVKGRGVTGEALGELQPPVDVLPLSIGVPLLCDGERIQAVSHGLHG